jgi:hypothetical protein
MAQQAIVRPTPATAPRTRRPPTTSPRPRGGSTGAAAKAKDTAKREAGRVKSTAASQAKQVKGTAVDQSKVVARAANDDVRQLAGTVRTQADQVTGELAGQAREMLAETRDQLQYQADVQATRVARALVQVGSQAVALSDGRPEEAGPLVDYAEQAAAWLDDAASYIEERGLEGIAVDVADFARRRPGLFLAGAAVLGFGVGRLVRSGAVSADGNGNGAVEAGWAEVE